MPRDQLSRRSVLRGAAGVGAAGIAATTLVGTGGAALAAPAQRETDHDARHDAERADAERKDAECAVAEGDQVVVHLRDVRSGQLHIFHGTDEVQVHDTELAARIVRASKRVK